MCGLLAEFSDWILKRWRSLSMHGRLLVSLLAGNAVLCAVLAVRQVISVECLECMSTGALAPLLAAILYGVFTLCEGYDKGRNLWVGTGFTLLVGAHGGLLYLALTRGVFCVPCMLVSVLAFAALIVRISRHPRELIIVAMVCPLAGAMMARAMLSTEWAYVQLRPDSPKVRLLVYERRDCPQCARFHAEIAPALAEQFKDKIEFVYIPVNRAPLAVRSVPTVVMLHPQGYEIAETATDALELSRAVETILQKYHQVPR